ncbi:MAG TPA: hypothetical protein VLR27_17740 [Acidimicrobiales bacterium]|nr:hypothetical protein [Acidimicrobiales bacterium]
MPRIRTLTAVGVLAGATVLGGAGLAGAADTSEPKDQELIEDSQTQQLTTFEGDEEIENEEAPTAPELPEAAADQARTALAEAPAFAGGDAESTDPDEETTEEQQVVAPEDGTTDDSEADGTKPDNHGQRVSEVARSDDPGPGPDHGPAVSEEAKKNGQGGDTDKTEED